MVQHVNVIRIVATAINIAMSAGMSKNCVRKDIASGCELVFAENNIYIVLMT